MPTPGGEHISAQYVGCYRPWFFSRQQTVLGYLTAASGIYEPHCIHAKPLLGCSLAESWKYPG